MPCVTTSREYNPRLQQAQRWLDSLGVEIQSEFVSIAGDASFRRYFRLGVNGVSRILMDAPPATKSLKPFIDIDRRLRAGGLHAPQIIHADINKGFLLLEDLGDDLYRGLLDKQSVASHFNELFAVLQKMALKVDCSGLPNYDKTHLQAELDLFPAWYLAHHRPKVQGDRFGSLWDTLCDCLIDSALAQQQCFVHRDFHSCNLLRTADGSVGIIDFQDAVRGPVSYDFISLLWDRYISWPRRQLLDWIESFRHLLGLETTPADWLRYCDLMGLQRNIKVVGIFARLYYRDGKQGYIEMIPQFYSYLLSSLRHYPEFADFRNFLEQPACTP